MSSNNFMKKLLDGVEVELKALGEVCILQRGTSATKNTLAQGNIPVISGGKEPSFYCNKFNRDGETITVAGSGAGAGFVQYWKEKIFVNDAFSIKTTDTLNTKYIFHYLLNIQDDICATKKGGGVPHVHISDIKDFPIPIPCPDNPKRSLEIQAEIVRILDTFTELTAELTAEVTARKKQYNYYRDRLLTFEEGEVEWKPVGEVAIIQRGAAARPIAKYIT